MNYAENGGSPAQLPAINFREPAFSPVRPAWQGPILPYDASLRQLAHPYRFIQDIGLWTETSAAQTFGISSSNRVSDVGGIHRSQFTGMIQVTALFDPNSNQPQYRLPPPAFLEQGGARIRSRDQAHAATIHSASSGHCGLAAYSTTADVNDSTVVFRYPRGDAWTAGSRSYVLCGAGEGSRGADGNHAANYADSNVEDTAANPADADAADTDTVDAVAADDADDAVGWTCPPRAWLEGGGEEPRV